MFPAFPCVSLIFPGRMFDSRIRDPKNSQLPAQGQITKATSYTEKDHRKNQKSGIKEGGTRWDTVDQWYITFTSHPVQKKCTSERAVVSKSQ